MQTKKQSRSSNYQQNRPNDLQQKKIKWSSSPSVQEFHSSSQASHVTHLHQSQPSPNFVNLTSSTDNSISNTYTTDSSNHSSKYLSRREKILASIKQFVESLPFLLHQSWNDMSIVLLNCADEHIRCTETASKFGTNQNYIPLSAQFKHTLTSSKLLTTDTVYHKLSESCTEAVLKMQHTVRTNMVTLQKHQVYAARLQHQYKYIHHTLLITHMRS